MGVIEYIVNGIRQTVSATTPLPVTVSGGGGGGPATIVDGGDVAEGTTTDAAVTTDVNGTLSGKLRGLVKILADVWDSVNHRLHVNVDNAISGSVSVSNFPALQTVTIADGGDITLGVRADAKSTATDNTPISLVSILKQISASVQAPPAQAISGTPTITDPGTTWGNAANRTVWSLSSILQTGATSDTVLTLTANANGVNAGPATTYTVPNGKTLRITSMYGEVLNTTTVANRVALTLRGVAIGTANATSPIIARVLAASQAALAASGGSDEVAFPEGISIPAGWSLCISQLCSVTTAGIVSVVVTGYIY